MTAAPRVRSAEPPLYLPWYRAPFVGALRRFFQKYATFSGRASRAEFWWVALALFVFPWVVQLVAGLITGDWRQEEPGTWGSARGILLNVVNLATLVPSLALGWRRLHDIGRTGLWTFFALVPLVGIVVVIVFAVTPARPEGQRFDRPSR